MFVAIVETDEKGMFREVTSPWGTGLPGGDYMVSFSYEVNEAGASAVAANEKYESNKLPQLKEMVAVPYYHEETKPNSSPARLTVSSGGENRLTFDVPSRP